MPETKFSFGPFTLSEAHGLLRAGQSVEVGQKALSILTQLLEADGLPVSKAKLLETCWPGQVVEEGNLTVQIATLRKALGQSDDGQDWIVTVPRLGYRLPRREAQNAPERQSLAHPRSIAVLPFRNLSEDRDNAYFAAGLDAEITSALARYKSLVVHSAGRGEVTGGDARSRAAALGVRFLVEGQAMRSGDKVRVVTSLIDGDTGAVMWNQRFDAAMSDIFTVQDQIAATIAAHVEPAISNQEFAQARRKPPANLSVYEMYLKANHLQLEGSIGSIKEAYMSCCMPHSSKTLVTHEPLV